jgi:hypothetical protein
MTIQSSEALIDHRRSKEDELLEPHRDGGFITPERGPECLVGLAGTVNLGQRVAQGCC